MFVDKPIDLSIWEKVFANGNVMDDFRYQSARSKWPVELFEILQKPLLVVQEFIKKKYPDYMVSEGNLLWSLPGGKNQELHRDFNPEQKSQKPPLVFFLAISDCRLNVAKVLNPHLQATQHEITKQRKIPPGSLLEFHGHAIHGGCGYPDHNFRFHFYAWHQDLSKEHPNKNEIVYIAEARSEITKYPLRNTHENSGAIEISSDSDYESNK